MASIRWPGEHRRGKKYVENPNQPIVTARGTVGTTAYTYYVVAKDWEGNKTNVSVATTITNGNAVLDANNFNEIKWSSIDGAVKYDILKGNTSTVIASDLSTNVYQDKGTSTTAYVPPIINETGEVIQAQNGIAIGGKYKINYNSAEDSLDITLL